MAFPRKFFNYLFLIFLALSTQILTGCTQQGPQLSPVEQLPNPETGKEKPQLYFLFETSSVFWNLPIPAEIDSKLRTHSHLVVSDDETVLSNSLREFNARSQDLLLIGSKKISPLVSSLSIFKHPTRALGLSVAPSSLHNFEWDLDSAFQLIFEFCQLNNSLLSCEFDPKIIDLRSEIAPQSQSTKFVASNKPKLLISFDHKAPNDKVLLSWDWVIWIEQMLRDLKNPSHSQSTAPWKKLSLENGNFKVLIQLSPQSPLYIHKEKLTESFNNLRMKYLQGM